MRVRWLVVLAVVMAVAVAVVVPAAATLAAELPGERTTTVLQAAAAVQDERSAPITVLLVGVGAVVGVIVGLVPALVVAMLLGYLPPPRLAGRRGGLLVEPARGVTAGYVDRELPGQRTRDRGAPAVRPAPAPEPAAPATAADEPPARPLGVLAQARHQTVYDAAYAEQLERVDALRASIGERRRRRPPPSGE